MVLHVDAVVGRACGSGGTPTPFLTTRILYSFIACQMQHIRVISRVGENLKNKT